MGIGRGSEFREVVVIVSSCLISYPRNLIGFHLPKPVFLQPGVNGWNPQVVVRFLVSSIKLLSSACQIWHFGMLITRDAGEGVVYPNLSVLATTGGQGAVAVGGWRFNGSAVCSKWATSTVLWFQTVGIYPSASLERYSAFSILDDFILHPNSSFDEIWLQEMS